MKQNEGTNGVGKARPNGCNNLGAVVDQPANRMRSVNYGHAARNRQSPPCNEPLWAEHPGPSGEREVALRLWPWLNATLVPAKNDFSALTAVFFTHLHSDHVVGFPDFWLTGWVMGRDTPLRVWGPVGTKAMTAHLMEAFSFDIATRRDLDEGLPGGGVQLEAKDIARGRGL